MFGKSNEIKSITIRYQDLKSLPIYESHAPTANWSKGFFSNLIKKVFKRDRRSCRMEVGGFIDKEKSSKPLSDKKQEIIRLEIIDKLIQIDMALILDGMELKKISDKDFHVFIDNYEKYSKEIEQYRSLANGNKDLNS